MRTKTLILTAALGAFGAASAMAQVYSVNAVGYINVSVPAGFSMIANQLNASPDNTLATLMPSPPDGTTVYKYTGTTYKIYTYLQLLGGWDDGTGTLNPGEGAFILNPGTAPFTVTFVGEVPQGTLTTHLPAGFAIVSSQVPQSGQLDTVLGYPPADGDTIYFFRNGTYSISTYLQLLGGWDTAPSPNVGEAFWSLKAAAADWTRTFSVNQ